VGIHACTDSFHSKDGIDPYIAMVGGEFVVHGAQQKGAMKVVSPNFPGMEGLGNAFSIFEEWYVLFKFAKDLHVILVQETEHMKGPAYQRPSYPPRGPACRARAGCSTPRWDTSKIWSTKTFRQGVIGGIAWTLHNVDAEVPPTSLKLRPRRWRQRSKTAAAEDQDDGARTV